MNTPLWPPLDSIRDAHGLAAATAPDAGSAAGPDDAATLELPALLSELVQRRQAVAALAQHAPWREGQLLRLWIDGHGYGVLLDQPEGGSAWRGWLASAELDWAGAFDVLLEPEDEPFEPAYGLIQAWNPVRIEISAALEPEVVGRLSSARLAAIRSVAGEAAAPDALGIAAQPGRIGLRSTGAGWSVLTGTPLAADDPRTPYQEMFRELAQRLQSAAQRTAMAGQPAGGTSPASGIWARLLGWFAVDRLVRPAFATLLVLVVLQGAGLWSVLQPEDEVRFRGAPEAAQGPAALVTVRLRAAASTEQLAALMQAAGAPLVAADPLPRRWVFHVADAELARGLLAASVIVEAVEAP